MIKPLRFLVLAVLVAVAWPAADRGALAQETAEATGVTELRELADTIEDEARRAELLRQINALIALRQAEAAAEETEPTLGAIIIEQVSAHTETLGRQLSSLASALLAAPAGVDRLREGLADPAKRAMWQEGALSLLAVLVGGYFAGRVVGRLLKRPLAAISIRAGESLLTRMPLLVARLLLILVQPAAFAAVGALLVGLAGDSGVTRPVVLSVIYAAALAGAINAVARTILAPGEAEARPVAMTDESAQYLYIWIRRVTVVGIYGFFAVQILEYLGLSAPAAAFLFKLVGLVLALLSVMLVMQNRRAVARMIAGEGSGRLPLLRRRLADLWHVLAILYFVISYLVWVIGMPGGFAYMVRATLLSALVTMLAVAVAGLAVGVVDRAFSLSDDVKRRLPGLEARVNRYLPFMRSALRYIVSLTAGLAVLQAWGLDILLWLGEPAGQALLGRLASIAAIVLLAAVIWETLSAAIERYLDSEDGLHSQRARTLLPLIRKVTFVVLSVVVGLTLLSELGIDIAPLLAGAGVVGLAVGFGAQTLVKDVITGLFILIEDTISVGDFVSLGGHDGTVEALSIRSIRLRDPAGTVHTVPFSDVTSVVNYTREFAYAVLEIGVGYGEDVDRVIEVIKEVGAELRADPDVGTSIQDDLQVLGLDSFGDSAVVIKVRIRTAPGMQWAIRRAYNRLLKIRFDKENIEIPFPQRTVWFADAGNADTGKMAAPSNSPGEAAAGG